MLCKKSSHGSLAQLVEQVPLKDKVQGPNPWRPTKQKSPVRDFFVWAKRPNSFGRDRDSDAGAMSRDAKERARPRGGG